MNVIVNSWIYASGCVHPSPNRCLDSSFQWGPSAMYIQRIQGIVGPLRYHNGDLESPLFFSSKSHYQVSIWNPVVRGNRRPHSKRVFRPPEPKLGLDRGPLSIRGVHSIPHSHYYWCCCCCCCCCCWLGSD